MRSKRWIAGVSILLLLTFSSLGFAQTYGEPARRKVDLPDFPEGAAYILSRLSNDELISIERSEPVYLAILTRDRLDIYLRLEAASELAKLRKTDELTQILDAIMRIDASEQQGGALIELLQLLLEEQPTDLKKKRAALVKLATAAKRDLLRQAGYALLLLADGEAEPTWLLAQASDQGLIDLLNGAAMIPDRNARALLYPKVEPLLHDAANRDIHQAAILAITSIPAHEEQTFTTLASFVAQDIERDTAIEALRQLPSTHWLKDQMPQLADSVVAYAKGVAPQNRNTPQFKRALQLGNELASLLPPVQGQKVRDVLGGLGIRIITIRTIPQLLLYDKSHIVVKAAEPVEITFENLDVMPHNVVIVAPGAMEEIGMAADRMIADPGSGDAGKFYVPDSDKVLYATPLVEARRSATLAFVAPQVIGEYPYICTFPGHWVRMNGIMHVVDDVSAWIAQNPDKAPGAQKVRTFVRAWKVNDLTTALDKLDSGRSLERGKALFAEASCLVCHEVRKVGGLIGPDLTEAATRLNPTEMLEQIIEPSKVINEQYRTWIIQLSSGQVIYGIITQEDAKSIHIVENPQANSEPIEIRRDQIDTMKASNLSTMPMGLLNVLSEQEILDLLAYIRGVKPGE